MRNLSGLVIVFVCLSALPPAALAAKFIKPGKERMVLMPLRVGEEDRSLQSAMETALVEGLQQTYEVFSGEQVAQKAKEIFLKESRTATKKLCDETRCMQGIAEAFQAELIATTNVTKRQDGYFLALSIQNIFDNKMVYSKSLPCKNCDAYQVVDKLKELAGTSAKSTASTEFEVPVVSGNPNDSETALWLEVQKGNTLDEYAAYLSQFPKGKYAVLGKARMKKLKDQAIAEMAKQEQSAWARANSIASDASYQAYLDTYPQGIYSKLAIARIAKLKKTARPPAAQTTSGTDFRDCPECPAMVVIQAGKFEMGSDNDEPNEKPLHSVTISRNFALGKTEVTQGQWRAVMGSRPSMFDSCGDDCPIENVSWNDAQDYIKKLNSQTGKEYRLPTEAEWEYACRAGGQQEYCGGDHVGSVAWYKDNSANKTHPVAAQEPNAFGLYDMSGNVWEWVEDTYQAGYSFARSMSSFIWSNDPGSFVHAPTDGSAWQGDGSQHVLRGGSWQYVPRFVRSASRLGSMPEDRSGEFGFRLARTLP